MTNQDNKTIKILFFGDMVGRPGRFAVRDFLAKNRTADFVMANVENASHGFGLTEKNYDELISYGINCMTSGNHIWDKKDIFDFIDNADKLIRPFNYPSNTPGKGSCVYELVNGEKIAVINFLGRVFMSPVESQWTMAAKEIERLKEITPVIIVDFHAEATAEKVCFARFCSKLGVSAFFGTHTHVQTADEKIIDGMAYITDAGFCGVSDGVIGMDYNTSLNRFISVAPYRLNIAQGDVQINAVEVDINPSNGLATSIKRISISVNEEKQNEK